MNTTATPRARITADEYGRFQEAFEFFNRELFAGALPDCLITLQRKPRMKGYYWPDQFRGRRDPEQCTDEIALNPETFGRTDEEILSTLVHEQVHLWQEKNGKPGRRGYHNQQWSEKMKAIGLQPTDTGEAGGKETGENMTHVITPAGPYAIACKKLLNSGYSLNWLATPEAPAERKKQTRAKYVCPMCELAAWAKPGARLLCAVCSEDEDEPVEMIAQETEAEA